MKKHLSRFNGIILLFLVIVSISCNINDLAFDNINVPNYGPEVAAPIGDASYTVRELIDELNDSTIVIDESNSKFLTVIYRDTSLFNDPADFITVGQIVNNDNLNPGISVPPSPVDALVPFSQSFEFQFQPTEGEQVDSAFYSSGTAELQVQSQFGSALSYTLKIVDFTHRNTGDTLTFTDNITASGVSVDTQDLTDFKTVFNRVMGQNNFSLIFEGELDVKAGESVSATDFLSFTLTIDNPQFSALFGFFGSNETSIQSQSIKLDFFSDIEPQGLSFNTPEINFLVNNSFGIPVGVLLGGISTSNSSGDFVQLSAGPNGDITDTVAVRAPLVSALGGSLNSAISINTDNSNIRDLLSIAPDSISIPIRGISNFQNESGQEVNFLTDSSFLETIAEVQLPLDVKLDGFTRTFDFDISSIDFNDADSIRLRVQTINDLPFSGTMTLDMLDDTNTVLYQVPTTILLQSPEVNNIDRTVESFHNISIIGLDQTGIDAFANATKITITMVVDSYQATDGTFVKIFADYELIIKLSAIANLNVKI